MLDSGATRTLISKTWVKANALNVDPLHVPCELWQAGSGKIIATSCIQSSIETPFGTIPVSQIPVADLQHQDLIIRTDLMDPTDIMLKVELISHRFSLDDLEKVRRQREETNLVDSEPKRFVSKTPDDQILTDDLAEKLQKMLIPDSLVCSKLNYPTPSDRSGKETLCTLYG